MENMADTAQTINSTASESMTTASHSARFPCNTCSRTFATNGLQRGHMRSSWHITNLRRRVAGLPALPEAEHTVESKAKTAGSRSDVPEPRRAEAPSTYQPKDRPDIEQSAVPSTQCLFCNLVSLSLHGNMSHMAAVHSLFIPSPGQLIDVESFVGYLALLVFDEHECLYCGVEKADVDSVQAHMRDKGHCMIKLDVESELLDFWDFLDEEGLPEEEDAASNSGNGKNRKGKGNTIQISETEMRLPSGAIANSRSASAIEHSQLKRSLWGARAKSRKAEQLALEQKSEEQPENRGNPVEETKDSRSQGNPSERRIAVRSEMGLVGLSDSQRRALQATEMKMKRKEALTAAAYRHAIEQQPVKTKYYKTENPVYQAG